MNSGKNAAAAGFDRPLLLSPGEDITGYVSSLIGRGALFMTAASSVVAILLIFIFIISKSGLFLTTRGGDAEHDWRNIQITRQANYAYNTALQGSAADEKQRALANYFDHVSSGFTAAQLAQADRVYEQAFANASTESEQFLHSESAEQTDQKKLNYYTLRRRQQIALQARVEYLSQFGTFHTTDQLAKAEEVYRAKMIATGDTQAARDARQKFLAELQPTYSEAVLHAAGQQYDQTLARTGSEAEARRARQALLDQATPQYTRSELDAAEQTYQETLLATGNVQAAQDARKEFLASAGQADPDRIAAGAQETFWTVVEKTGDFSRAERAKAEFLASAEPTLAETAGTVTDRLEEALGSTKWYPTHEEHAEFGLLTKIFGSVMITIGALLIAVPLGLTAAVVLSDILPFRIRQIVKPIVELLAAIPSVAFGFFAVMVVAPWMRDTFGLSTGTNALNCAVILAVMAIPTIVSVAEDSLTALGRELREASYACGATRAETIWKVIIPAAHNGILAAVILGMMRAIGETMVVLMASGHMSHIPTPWYDLTQSVSTMTATVAAEMGEAPAESIHRSVLFFTGCVLLVFTFILNIVSEYFTSRFRMAMDPSLAASKRARARSGLGRAKQMLGRGAGFVGNVALWLGGMLIPAALLYALTSWACRQFGVTGESRVVASYIVAGVLAAWMLARSAVAAFQGGMAELRKVGWLHLWMPLTALKSALIGATHSLGQMARMRMRIWADRGFTGFAYSSVLLLMLALLVVLGPMIGKGVTAVVFKETIGFRLYLLEVQNRGDQEEIQTQWEQVQQARQPVFDALRRVSWLDPEENLKDIRQIKTSTDDVLAKRRELMQADYNQKAKEIEAKINEARRPAKLARQAYLETVDPVYTDEQLQRGQAMYQRVLARTNDADAATKARKAYLRATYEPQYTQEQLAKAEAIYNDRLAETGADAKVKQLTDQKTELAVKLNAFQDRLEDIDRANRRLFRRMRDAYEGTDKDRVNDKLDYVLEYDDKELLQDTPASSYFPLAAEYKDIVQDADLTLRGKTTEVSDRVTYQKAYQDVRERVKYLLGPENREDVSHLPPEKRFGAPRWDMAQRWQQDLLVTQVYVPTYVDDPEAPGGQRRGFDRKTIVPRRDLFVGTAAEEPMDQLLLAVENDLEAMMQPDLIFYGRYITDNATAGNFLGGVGPEALGTLMLTALCILVALPLGVVTAAYLVEVAGENVVVRFIRMCINTLAGVPSIVFGLWGLALWVDAVFGKPMIKAGSLTLAALVLPVIIRASEEAIRSVPNTYREASLGLGASKLRTFIKVTLPAALPGILTGMILGLSRAAGETAPVLLTAAVAVGNYPDGLNSATPTLASSSYFLAMGDRVGDMVPHNQYGMVTTLVTLVLLLNLTAILVRGRVSKKLRGQ